MHNRHTARILVFCATSLFALQLSAGSPPSELGTYLKAQRDKLKGFHQEFEYTRTYRTASGSRSAKQQLILDVSGAEWRERFVGGSGNHITIFNGAEFLSAEEGSDEYRRTKSSAKGDDPEPLPYGLGDPDWPKAKEVRRQPCGFEKNDRECVVVDVPLKQKVRANSASTFTKMLEGTSRIEFDTVTGLLLSSQTVQLFERERGSYESHITYLAKAMRYGSPADASLFQLPPEATREVKEFSRWNAARIKKQLVGQVAPELAVTDIDGKPVMLSAFQGKTVLLDFWTTWCPPCRADAPALDRLQRKYGGKELVIIGISVSEDREIVKKFLEEHHHDFPIVLTSENEMPRPYQIALFPTYIVIDADGSVSAAVEGDKGFPELQKLLKKAGVEAE
jgi:thiol-disulfide isomerase/thioredoxin